MDPINTHTHIHIHTHTQQVYPILFLKNKSRQFSEHTLTHVESSEMCRKHTSCLDPQIKVTAWLILH